MNKFALLLASTLIALAACSNDGPMENAGEEVDEAVDSAGRNLEEAGENIDDAVDDATD